LSNVSKSAQSVPVKGTAQATSSSWCASRQRRRLQPEIHPNLRASVAIRLRLKLLLLPVVVALSTIGCGRKDPMPKDVLTDLQELAQAEAAYRTNNFQNAWTNLLRHRDALKAWQSSGKQGLNFPLNLAVVNGRLAVMAQEVGRTNDAVAFFEESARYFNEQNARLNLPETNYSAEAVSRLIQYWDGTNFAAWRRSKNEMPPSHPP
jgi:hypothetical protein